jgi:hypothetical protein
VTPEELVARMVELPAAERERVLDGFLAGAQEIQHRPGHAEMFGYIVAVADALTRIIEGGTPDDALGAFREWHDALVADAVVMMDDLLGGDG